MPTLDNYSIKNTKKEAPETNNFLFHLFENKMGALINEILSMLGEHFAQEQNMHFKEQ